MHLMNKGNESYLAMVQDVEVVVSSLYQVPMVMEFPEVFLEELPGMPPDREIEFCINLSLDVQPVSIPPYQMTSKIVRVKCSIARYAGEGLHPPRHITVRCSLWRKGMGQCGYVWIIDNSTD